ncbi:MAG TPA: M20/M25/M40 family metallo-hydrolase [Candidatus Hydrogenedentes bacterium]|nr:M20/M25/M40 family metallo-hydrolase [Candidatus Hydrogenedentota bacterium]
MNSSCRRTWLPLVVILLVVLASWWASLPPTPKPATAPPDQFSAERAMVHLKELARAPHPAGSPENDRVFQTLISILRGLNVEVETIEGPVRHGDRGLVWERAVLARVRGTDPSGKAIAVDAHFDSTPYGPGAADDLSGCVAMLETCRALKHLPPLRHDVIFVFSDQEETGGYGARAFTRHQWYENVAVVTGLETRGVSGPSLMFETSNHNGPLIRHLARSGAPTRTNSIFFGVYDRLPFGSNFGKYKQTRPGYNLAFVDGFCYYHTMLDRPDKVSLASLQHHGEHVLALCRYYGNLDSLDREELYGPNLTYFNLFGSNLVYYPPWVDHLLLGLGLALLGTGLGTGFSRGALRPGGLVAALGLAVGCVVLATAAAFAAGVVPIFIWRETALYSYKHYAAAAGLLAAGLCGAVCGWRVPRPAELAAAGLLLWLVPLGVFYRYAAEGLHLAVFPLLAGGIGLLASSRRPEGIPHGSARLVTLVLWIPVISIQAPLLVYCLHTLTSAAMVVLGPLAVLLVLMMAPLTEPLFRMGWRLRAATVLLLLGGGVSLLGLGLAHNRPSPDTPALNCLCYAVDFREGRAWWLSSDRNNAEWFRDLFKREFPFGLYRNNPPTDAWTRQYFPPGTTRETAGPFRPGDQRAYLKAAAALPPFGPLSMETLEQTADDGQTRWKVRVRSPRQASRVWARNDSGHPLTGLSIGGIALRDCGPGEDLQLFYMSGEGTEMTFTLPSDVKPVFEVREESWIMHTDIEGFTPRPPHMAPEPNRVMDFYSRMHSEHVYSLARVSPEPAGP